MTDTCRHCGGSIEIRNPTGACDHLYWPDNLTDEAKRANGLPVEFKPDWTLDPTDGLAVVLSMVMARRIPGWPGATDDQLEAAAADIIAADKEKIALRARVAAVEKERDAAVLAEREACAGIAERSQGPTNQARNNVCKYISETIRARSILSSTDATEGNANDK